ncbi:MAG: M48 family metalloprotease, partial [Flavobacteriales bacterium]
SIIESSFVTSELLLSGNVVFNDTLSGYIKLVAKELLKNDIETLSKLNFFVVKSAFVSTLSNQEGIVLISTGLLARINNEAQLAFILAREIAHFQLKHQAKLYLNNDINNNGAYNLKHIEDNLLKYSNFSQEQEEQADSLASVLINNSNYSSAAVVDVLKIFNAENHPVAQEPFDINYFNSKYFKIPDTYFFIQVNPINEADENYTQPNISARNLALKNRMNDDVDSFLLPKNQFHYCRDIARFEMSSLYLNERQYASAIYNSYLLLKKYPNNEFLLSNIANSLYFLAKYSNKSILQYVNVHHENIQGESQQLHLLFSVMKKEELDVLAIQYLWKTYFAFSHRKDLKKKAIELMNEMLKLYPVSNSFSESVPTTDTVALKPVAPAIGGKMKANHYYGYGKRPADTSKIDTRLAFCELFQNEEFKQAFNNAKSNKELPQIPSTIVYYSQGLTSYNQPSTKPMHLNKIVMVDPSYFKINNTFFTEKFNALESENARKEYSKSIKEIAKKAKLDIELLDSKFLNTKQVSLFNDIARLNNFIDELNKHRDLDSVLSADYQLVDMLIEKHKTKYLGWNSVFALTEPDAMADPVNLIMYCIYLPVLAPYFFYDAATPDFYTYHYMMVADIEKGKVIFNKSYQIIGKDTPDRLKSNLYYNFLQLGGGKGKKK